MALTVTPNLSPISLCEATTGWTGGQGYLAIEQPAWQGTYCLGDWVNNTTQAVCKYDLGSGGTNMNNGEHIYVWMFCSGAVDTKASGGYRIYAEDTTGNWATWYVGGVDTHPAGGWNIFCTALTATPGASSGTLNKSLIRYVGVQFKTTTAAPIKGQTRFNNVFWDAVRYGKGLTITSLATDNITIADIYAVDAGNTLKYGVVTKPPGINAYVITGKLTIGDSTGTGSAKINFDTSAITFPQNDLLAAGFNGIVGTGNATGTTSITINGCYVASYGTAFDLDFSHQYVTSCNVSGNTLVKASSPLFKAGQTVYGNVFAGCGMVRPELSTFTYNTIKNSTATGAGTGAMRCPLTNNLDHITFNANDRDVLIDEAGTYGDSFTHGTNNYDIDYNNASAATFNVPGTGNTDSRINTGAGTMTVYADDGSTPLFVANLWENVAQTQKYRGQGAEVRERLE